MPGAAGSLSTMTSSCLQQARDHHHHHHASYPYMFPDPLHTLSPTYAHAARVNPAMAHSQPPTTAHHPAAYTPSPGSTVSPTTTGTGNGMIADISREKKRARKLHANRIAKTNHIFFFLFLFFRKYRCYLSRCLRSGSDSEPKSRES